MTSEGSAHGRFQRAIQRRNLLAAETARPRARLALSRRRARSACSTKHKAIPVSSGHFGAPCAQAAALSHEEVELLRAAAGALRSSFREIGLETLERACAQLGLPRPTLPVAREDSPPAAGKPMRST